MDLRIQKTKAAVKEAFLELRHKKPIEKITVTELSKLAGINKATFYLHYSDIYSLADEMEDEVIDDILAELQGPNKLFDDPKQYFADMFSAFMKKRTMLNYIFSGSRYSQFAKKTEERIKAHLYTELPKLRSHRNDIVLSFLIQGTFHTVASSIPDKVGDYSEEFSIITRITDSMINELVQPED
ncbi:MAG: TetR/AcrR family transcriptional regulator [Oscillospiraceae bacterium]